MINLVDISAAHRAKLAAEIRKRRERAGITWKALADHCGVSIRTAIRWGGTDANPPEARHLAALDQLFAAHK